MEFRLGDIDNAVEPESRMLFQSLFWWNFVWGRNRNGRREPDSDVSILVLVEFRLGEGEVERQSTGRIWFQSLFWWNFVWGS